MPRTQDCEAMYCILAKIKKSPKPFKTLGKTRFWAARKKELNGYRETIEHLRKINNSSAALVPEVHVERRGQCKKQPRTIENPRENDSAAIVIPCRPQIWPLPLNGCPETLEILGKFNNRQGRSRPAAANSELARLEHAARLRENPIGKHAFHSL